MDGIKLHIKSDINLLQIKRSLTSRDVETYSSTLVVRKTVVNEKNFKIYSYRKDPDNIENKNFLKTLKKINKIKHALKIEQVIETDFYLHVLFQPFEYIRLID